MGEIAVRLTVCSLRKLYTCLVDNEDYVLLKSYNWRALEVAGNIYARRTGPDGITVLMHREIMQVPDTMVIDHRNGNTLDNRRKNLRVATQQQNMMNTAKMNISTSSIYKGVDWNEYHQKWRARVASKYIGYFDSEEEAAIAYNVEAYKQFGEFVQINHILK